jgi:hypothetical protein
MEVPFAITLIYIFTWIFIGNYILLNLFLAILLDEFTTNDDKNEEEEEIESDEKNKLK